MRWDPPNGERQHHLLRRADLCRADPRPNRSRRARHAHFVKAAAERHVLHLYRGRHHQRWRRGRNPPPSEPVTPTDPAGRSHRPRGQPGRTVGPSSPGRPRNRTAAGRSISYTVTTFAGGDPLRTDVLLPSTTAVIGNLANGTAYTFTVEATNAAGRGPASAPSPAVIPAEPVPEAPPPPPPPPAVNHPPVAAPDGYQVTAGVTLSPSPAAQGVLANDQDPDGDVLTADRHRRPGPRHRQDGRPRRVHLHAGAGLGRLRLRSATRPGTASEVSAPPPSPSTPVPPRRRCAATGCSPTAARSTTSGTPRALRRRLVGRDRPRADAGRRRLLDPPRGRCRRQLRRRPRPRRVPCPAAGREGRQPVGHSVREGLLDLHQRRPCLRLRRRAPLRRHVRHRPQRARPRLRGDTVRAGLLDGRLRRRHLQLRGRQVLRIDGRRPPQPAGHVDGPRPRRHRLLARRLRRRHLRLRRRLLRIDGLRPGSTSRSPAWSPGRPAT